MRPIYGVRMDLDKEIEKIRKRDQDWETDIIAAYNREQEYQKRADIVRTEMNKTFLKLREHTRRMRVRYK